MAQQASISVMFVNAKNDKRFSSIKTKEMGYVSVPTAQINSFQQNRTYEILYEITPEGYKNFVGFAQAQQATPPVQSPAYAPERPNGGYQARGYAPQAPLPGPRQQTQPSKPQSVANPDARMIFLTGTLGRALQSGKFMVGDIRQLTRELIVAYDLTQGIPPPYRQEESPPFNDDINDVGDDSRPPF